MPSLALKDFRWVTTFGVVAACSSLIFAHAPVAQAGCTFLMPIGGNGDGPKPYIVKKRVERPKGLIGKAVGRTNWNTDFVVNQPYASYKLFFTADSTDNNPGSYPIEAFLKFADGSNLKVVDEFMKPPTGTGAQFGPLMAPSGKAVSQVNFRIGANNDPGATGFSYRISVQGCD
jgi:hypothetical protein